MVEQIERRFGKFVASLWVWSVMAGVAAWAWNQVFSAFGVCLK